MNDTVASESLAGFKRGYIAALLNEQNYFQQRALSFKLAAQYMYTDAVLNDPIVTDKNSLRLYLGELMSQVKVYGNLDQLSDYEVSFKSLARMEALVTREVMYHARKDNTLKEIFSENFLQSRGEGFTLTERLLDEVTRKAEIFEDCEEVSSTPVDGFLNIDLNSSTSGMDCRDNFFNNTLKLEYVDRENKPWYQALSKPEQAYCDRVVREAEENPAKWDLVFTPHLATARNTLGVANASSTSLAYGAEQTKQFTLYRQGIPTPVTAKVDRAEKVRMATLNLHQYFYTNLEEFIQNRKNKDEAMIHIAFQSLLTPATFEVVPFSDNNTEMLAIYREAIENLRASVKNKGFYLKSKMYIFNIIDSNQPVNGHRPFLRATEERRRAVKMREYLQLVGIKSIPKTADGIARSIKNLEEGSLLKATVKCYLETWNQKEDWQDNRNHAMWLAALESILVTEAGGFSVIGCKSAKDRTGLVQDCAFALVKTFSDQGALPAYAAGRDNAVYKAYVENFKAIQATDHQKKQASRNALGARGLKNEDFYLNKHPIQRIVIFLLAPLVGLLRGVLAGIDRSHDVSHYPAIRMVAAVVLAFVYGLLGLLTGYVSQAPLLFKSAVMTPKDLGNSQENISLAKSNKPKPTKPKSTKSVLASLSTFAKGGARAYQTLSDDDKSPRQTVKG